jgi:hypothetical protein
MNRRSIVLLSAVLLTAFQSVSAQEWGAEGNPMSQFPQALGGTYGPMIGTGLSYQRWFEGVGIQTAVGAVYSPEEQFSGDLLWYRVTFGLQRILYHETFADWFAGGLYAFGALAHGGRIEWVTEPVDTQEPADPQPGPFRPLVAVGAGVGIESVLFRHFSVPVEFGLSVEWEIPSVVPVSAGFVGGVGLRYRF